MAPVGPAGIVVGNWTLTNQFALDGLVDRVRVWKHDEDALVRAFGGRDLDARGRDEWDELWTCLAQALERGALESLRSVERSWRVLFREIVRAMHDADPEERARLPAALASYRKNWADTVVDLPQPRGDAPPPRRYGTYGPCGRPDDRLQAGLWWALS
jgi:hypothetical protein